MTNDGFFRHRTFFSQPDLFFTTCQGNPKIACKNPRRSPSLLAHAAKMATGVSGQPYSRLSQPVETLEGNALVREAATLSSAPSQEPPEPVSGPAAPPALGTSSAASTPSSAASTPSPTGKMRWKSIKRTSTGLLAAVRATSAFAEASARAAPHFATPPVPPRSVGLALNASWRLLRRLDTAPTSAATHLHAPLVRTA